ncbi:hypothetical protein CONLIGDRAFT_571547 [Coniochaeta ligniaria NRRL 30616]|uniref:Heme haloperoxidase family profile domain-containing protein n=1 Tax=Coniochaeta ligniaria NRRL 30616 TaxID=1408157 RepID=A0A1J7IXX1_9PEZI|nr:hypothetical protein CONLIGDRAFT_571547 [Coniochaeta ligniaria NRRL 30616]
MLFKKVTSVLAVAGGVAAQRPSNMSICDYYTTALLTNNTAENQYTLLTLLVNTVVIGNYTMPNVGVAVPGILAPGTVDGEDVNLAPYFTGALASTNKGGMTGESVNFLDGGGAAPLMKNMPADDDSSNQYFLLTHLYQFFGGLLQCSQYGMGAFPAYTGDKSMYEVHKFMALDNAEVTYFITQVGLAASSFGVTEADVTAVGTALNSLFGRRCAPAVEVIPPQGAALQAICTEPDCPIADGAMCGLYDNVVEPSSVSSMAGNATMTGNMTTTMSGHATTTVVTTTDASGSVMTFTSTGMATGTTMAPTATVSTAGAAATGLSLMAVAGGIAAMLL